MRKALGEGVRLIIERLNSYGRRADVVGGCVRDFLLKKKPYDFDITTDATPEEMKEIFCDMKTLDIGIKHGTLTVFFDNIPYEITTYRVESEYADHRHPTSVSFSRNLIDDLSRRDFTMNAICYNENDGFTDAFSGIEDIKNKIIRAVGNPYDRFDEDALRIMRALRFSATLGFTIEENTASALIEKAHLLSYISKERILAEWRKLIAGKYAYDVIYAFPTIISLILGIDNKLCLMDKESFNSLPWELREISIHLNGENPTGSFIRFAERLGIEKRMKRLGEELLSSPFREMPSIVDIRFSFSEIGIENTIKKLTLYSAYNGCAITSDEWEMIERVKSLPYKISHLDIDGNDIISLGASGGAVGKWLNILLTLVIKGDIENKKNILINYIKSNL